MRTPELDRKMVITQADLETDWLNPVGYLNNKFPVTRKRIKRKDGTSYRVIYSELCLPINIDEAAYECGDEDILEDVKKYWELN